MRVIEGEATVEDLDGFLDRLGAIGETHGVAVQAFDARYVVDREHLRRAVELANRAVRRGEAIARDRAVEILLYAAGRRQIDRSLAMGVAEGHSRVVVVVDAGSGTEDGEAAAADAVREVLTPAATLGDYDPGLVRDFFDVTDTELAATEGTLADAVHERVALLVVER
jgi:KEOPS complex subunit Cgi121